MEKNIEVLSKEFSLGAGCVENIVRLLDEGNTVPFIARYRKEMHGSTDDQTIRKIEERLRSLRALEARRAEVAAAIDGQGRLTDELRGAIENAPSLSALEDIYRPYRPKRRTRASVAREKGLEPLALALMSREGGAPEQLAKNYVNREKGVSTAAEALQGANDIAAEIISDDAALRGELRQLYERRGECISAAATEEDGVYGQYYAFRAPLSRLRSHQILALNRGEREGALRVKFSVEEDEALRVIRRRFVHPASPSARFVSAAGEDAWGRLLKDAMEREQRAAATERANEQAMDAFAGNLSALLMQPPLRGRVTMGFDPAYRTGCKIAVVDATGKLLDTAVVYPTPPHNRTEEAKKTLLALIHRHGVTAIAIGNGTASKESEIFVADMIRQTPEVAYMVVSEAGASVYSASPLAAGELPGCDVSLRSAVSIARRLQDPLSELVKIEPMAIGVGQYQHDMPRRRLEETLCAVVEDCVNRVGVDLNTASPALLRQVAGLNAALSGKIVRYREENGPFKTRRELLKVPGIGAKTFEQCAGFLRIPGGKTVMDNTGVHPESYGAARKLLALCDCWEEDAARQRCGDLREKFAALGREKIESCGVGVPTAMDIAAELMKPGRDPRSELPPAQLRRDVMGLEDLRTGMVLHGTVRNVVDFGAFVDIGVHQDGLVHISRLSDGFVKRPGDVVSVGDVVEVAVIEVDPKKKRISLSMKSEDKGQS